MTPELQSKLKASGIEWPALRNHIPWMAHVIQLALGAFMSSLGVKGRTKSWEAHERDQQLGETKSIDIGKSQWLRKEGNARINKVSAMRPGIAKIIEKVRSSWYFESPEADLHIAENACWMNYTDTWLPKRVHSLSKSQSLHCGTSDYGWEHTFELYSGVARVRLPITGIYTRVASEPKLHWMPAALLNSGWMDDFQVCHGSIEAISILDLLEVEDAHSPIAWRYRSVQWHVRSHGWRYVRLGFEEDTIEGRLELRCNVGSTEAVQILHWKDSNNWHASDFRTYPGSFPEFATLLKVGQGNG